MFPELKSNLNHTVLGVHRLDNGEEVQWDAGVAHGFCQGTMGGLAMSYPGLLDRVMKSSLLF